MKFPGLKIGGWIVTATLCLPADSLAATSRCLPTCDVTDGRMLAIAGSNLLTPNAPEILLQIAVPAGVTSFQLGIFDGDGGLLDAQGDSHWDLGSSEIFEYALYADPMADGAGQTLVDLQPGSPVVFSSALADNGWTDFTVATGPVARTPSGNYFYRLSVRLPNAGMTTLNAFKVRVSADAVLSGLTLEPLKKPFSLIAQWTNLADLKIVYPSFSFDPSTGAFGGVVPTTYDGAFDLYFDIPVTRRDLVVWDADFDRGGFNGTQLDTDDLDTDATLPEWATPETMPEGLAVGDLVGAGSPADDGDPAGLGAFLVRPPAVHYSVSTPGGAATFLNDNPSGNQEWEQFRISTDPFNPLEMDATTSDVPPGIYRLRIEGLDMQNLISLLLPGRLVCREESGVPCPVLRPYLLGDTVFLDGNGNGLQDAGEPGIPGVALNLRDAAGALLGTTTTSSTGAYAFEAESEVYTVEVVPSNFLAGGPLSGLLSTTGGERRTEEVVQDNVLTFDFGYRRPAQPGTGTLGYWKTHPEAWPVQQITVGGVTWSKAQAISLMEEPGRGDKTYDQFKQLVAAKLNVLVGNDASCIASTIAAADAWLALHPVGSGVRSSSAAWSTGGPLHQALDDYNNGRLCAPHRG